MSEEEKANQKPTRRIEREETIEAIDDWIRFIALKTVVRWLAEVV